MFHVQRAKKSEGLLLDLHMQEHTVKQYLQCIYVLAQTSILIPYSVMSSGSRVEYSSAVQTTWLVYACRYG